MVVLLSFPCSTIRMFRLQVDVPLQTSSVLLMPSGQPAFTSVRGSSLPATHEYLGGVNHGLLVLLLNAFFFPGFVARPRLLLCCCSS